MKKNDYLFAVASVRALENNLLKQSDLEQLINAEDYKKATALLSDKGYDLNSGQDYSEVLDSELLKVWDYVSAAAPEADALKLFIVKNDFQNLKAALKAEVMKYNAEDFFVTPCIIEHKDLLECVSNRRFNDLPEYISEAAEQAFSTLTKTGNGQLCDAIIDTATLKTILSLAESSGDNVLCEYARLYCVAADIKTAYRAVKTGKNSVFLGYAIAECSGLNKNDIINAALEGEEAFSDYLNNSGLSDYNSALEQGGSVFEKFCDDKMLEAIKKAKMTAFGISPLAAYFVAKETEIKCLRIILSAKQSYVSSEIIRERMRELYV